MLGHLQVAMSALPVGREELSIDLNVHTYSLSMIE